MKLVSCGVASGLRGLGGVLVCAGILASLTGRLQAGEPMVPAINIHNPDKIRSLDMSFAPAGAALLQPVSFRVGAPVPALAVTTPAGQPIDLRALKGRVVLVTFWATWCGPCLMEFPIIEKFYKKHHADGFEAVAVSIDEPRTKERAEKILARLPFPGALLHSAHLNGFGIPEFVPQSFVIDARGVMRNWFTRNIEERDLNRSVLPLLKEVSAAPDSWPGANGSQPVSEDFAPPKRGSNLRGF